MFLLIIGLLLFLPTYSLFANVYLPLKEKTVPVTSSGYWLFRYLPSHHYLNTLLSPNTVRRDETTISASKASKPLVSKPKKKDI